MSIAIDIGNITGVLLADGWHEVYDGSFETDYSYEFIWKTRDGLPSLGAKWLEDDGCVTMCCPLTAILAVREVG